MRALVTGAMGFAGRHMVDHLHAQGDEVLQTGLEEEVANVAGAAALNVQDAQACSAVMDNFRPQAVYHLAGLAFAPAAERDFRAALLVNVYGTFNILQAAAQLGSACKVLAISSSEVYGKVSTQDLPLTEDTPVRPPHNYALSKAMTEQTVMRFWHGSAWGAENALIVRAFNHIGRGQHPDFVVSSFARQLAQIAHGQRDDVLMVGNLEARRDFTDVRDIVRGYRLIVEKGRGLYNLCSGRSVSIQEILDTLVEISGVKVRVQQDPERMRPSEVPELYGSFARARHELGWQPEYDLRRSLHDVYEYWYKSL